jgi:hypothetical protein
MEKMLSILNPLVMIICCVIYFYYKYQPKHKTISKRMTIVAIILSSSFVLEVKNSFFNDLNDGMSLVATLSFWVTMLVSFGGTEILQIFGKYEKVFRKYEKISRMIFFILLLFNLGVMCWVVYLKSL